MDGPIADVNGVKLLLKSLLNACTFRISIFKKTSENVWPYCVDFQMCSTSDIYSTTSCLSCILGDTIEIKLYMPTSFYVLLFFTSLGFIYLHQTVCFCHSFEKRITFWKNGSLFVKWITFWKNQLFGIDNATPGHSRSE